MAIIKGNTDADQLTGTDADDRITGRDGDDVIDAGAGHDWVNGGSDDDRIQGGAGDHTLFGGDGDDRIEDAAGGATIDGGGGNDTVYISRRDVEAVDRVAIGTGTGNDWVYFGSDGGGDATIDLGDGEDRVRLYGFSGDTTITTGVGRDWISLYVAYPLGSRAIVVTDFTAGNDGDRLSLTEWLGWNLLDWKGARNPFEQGFLRLVQDGADTLVQVDIDGRRRGHGFTTLFVLQDVEATTLTAANFIGFSPDGARSTGLRTTGTDFGDRITGTTGADRIDGGAGDDYLVGDAGRDRLWGGAGHDYLRGDAGDDHLFGGDGNDTLSDDGGSNFIDAGAGNDRIYHQLVTGGTSGGGGSETILAGDGNDYVRYQNNRSGGLTLNLGSGDDQLEIYTIQDGGAQVTTGSGRDIIAIGLDRIDHFEGVLNVTDFTAGFGGDRLELRRFLSDLTDWDGGDPFAVGFVRLTDVGDATLIDIDRDGNAGPLGFTTLVRLNGVAAAAIEAANFDLFAPSEMIPVGAGNLV